MKNHLIALTPMMKKDKEGNVASERSQYSNTSAVIYSNNGY